MITIMAVFCKPFTVAKIQYFAYAKLEKAKAWITKELDEIPVCFRVPDEV